MNIISIILNKFYKLLYLNESQIRKERGNSLKILLQKDLLFPDFKNLSNSSTDALFSEAI